jgi:hypothetical protein
MDISVLAAVGSFVVSERVLKPKATLLAILVAILAYDLTTKTRDPSSLRVYRGPALLGVALGMVALSLRQWRRNGIACDELLFLPGTPQERVSTTTLTTANTNAANNSSGVMDTEDDSNEGRSGAANIDSSSSNNNRHQEEEEDAAAGGTTTHADSCRRTNSPRKPSLNTRIHPQRQQHTSNTSSGMNGRGTGGRIQSNCDSSISSIRDFVNKWDDDTEEEAEDDLEQEHVPLQRQQQPRHASSNTMIVDTRYNLHRSNTNESTMSPERTATSPAHTMGENFRDQHPGITRIGSFFFFRTNNTSTRNESYAPSGPSVVGAALDLVVPTLFNFHLFIEAFNHYGPDSPAAKSLPLIFWTVLMFRALFPPGRRCRFWKTLACTFRAPFLQSRLRDSFLGDVLTSLIRPGQDVLVALSYYVTVMFSMFSYGHTASASTILESSWILHNVLLPSCALFPLWFKFLQTLRESYDTGERWPHLGNAFKYMSAAWVILYGMTHPEDRRGPLWLLCFSLCWLYQIGWDTFMDWELLVIAPKPINDCELDPENWWCVARISSVNPNNRLLLMLQRNVLQPVRDAVVCFVRKIPSWRQIQLRPNRLYKTKGFYWRILFYNSLFRFTWMLTFIPAYRLSSSGRHHVTTFSSDTNSYVGVILPIAEIIRRTLWAFLYLEMKTIKLTDDDPQFMRIESANLDEVLESSECPDAYDIKPPRWSCVPSWILNQPQMQQDSFNGSAFGFRRRLQWILECDDEMRRRLFIAELSGWALAFVVVGMWATN